MSKLRDLIENVVIAYNGSPYKDDAFVESATWIKTGESLTDKELDELDIDECLDFIWHEEFKKS
jgi:hypothetical protein